MTVHGEIHDHHRGNLLTASGDIQMTVDTLGNGQAISSDERDNSGVHIFSISARNAGGYNELGYVIPG